MRVPVSPRPRQHYLFSGCWFLAIWWMQSGSSLWCRFVFPLEWMASGTIWCTHWAFEYLLGGKVYSNALSPPQAIVSVCVCVCEEHACGSQKDHLRCWRVFFETGSLPWSLLHISDKLLVASQNPLTSGALGLQCTLQYLALPGLWGFELRTSCLHGRRMYPLNHLRSPFGPHFLSV